MVPEGARKKGRNRGAGKAPGREEWKDGGDMYISYMKTKREAGVPEKTESGKERIQMCRVCRRGGGEIDRAGEEQEYVGLEKRLDAF